MRGRKLFRRRSEQGEQESVMKVCKGSVSSSGGRKELLGSPGGGCREEEEVKKKIKGLKEQTDLSFSPVKEKLSISFH